MQRLCRNLRKSVRASETSFLVGSGISIPSGLPSGMAFNRHLVAELSANRKQVQAIAKLLVMTDADRGQSRIRFEQLLGILRETVDPNLSVLRILDADVPPNSVHFFLASALKSGAAVFTTNFDSLIEKAYHAHPLTRPSTSACLKIACINEQCQALPKCSFEELASSRRDNVLFKLHGTISLNGRPRQAHAGNQTALSSSVGATLDRIGNSGASLRLEEFKHHALETHTKGRTLVVLGYSGLDDFDVGPSLCEIVSSLSQLVWIVHGDRAPRVLRNPASHVPAKFIDAANEHRIPFAAIVGRTPEVLKILFKSNLTSQAPLSLSTHPPIPPAMHLTRWDKLFVTARLFYLACDYKKAAALFGEAQRYSKRRHRENDTAKAVEWRSSACFESGKTRKGFYYNEEAYRLNRKLGNKVPCAVILLDRARMLKSLGHAGKALQVCKRSKRLLWNTFATKNYESACVLEVELRRMLGQVKQSLAVASSTIQLCRKHRNRRGEAACFVVLSQLHREKGRPAKAISYARRAQKYYELLGIMSGLVSSYNVEGNVYVQSGEPAKAIVAYSKALAIAERIGRRRSVAMLLGNIAIAFRLQGRLGQAIKQLKRALVENRRIGNKEGVARDVENIGVCHLQNGSVEIAETWLTQALTINKAIASPEKIAITLNNIATSRRRQGDYHGAMVLIRKALAINRRLCRPLGIAAVLQNRAEVEYAAGKIDAAYSTACEAFDIADRGSYGEEIISTAELMAHICHGRGLIKPAKKHWRIANQHAQRVGDAKCLTRLAKLGRAIMS